MLEENIDPDADVDVRRLLNRERKAQELEWMKHHNERQYKRLQRQKKDSNSVRELVKSIVATSEDPANELAEELLFAGSLTHFDALIDSSVSVTSYCRVMEKQVRRTGEEPYRNIVKALKDIHKQTPSSSNLNAHTNLVERRRKLMMRAMMDTEDPKATGHESRQSARNKLDHFIAYKSPQHLADVDDNEEFLLPSEEEDLRLKREEEEKESEQERQRLMEEELERERRSGGRWADGSIHTNMDSGGGIGTRGSTGQSSRQPSKPSTASSGWTTTASAASVESSTLEDHFQEAKENRPAEEGVLPDITLQPGSPAQPQSRGPPRSPSRTLPRSPTGRPVSRAPLGVNIEEMEPWNPIPWEGTLRIPDSPQRELDSAQKNLRERYPPFDGTVDSAALGEALPSLLEEEEWLTRTNQLAEERRQARLNSQKFRKPRKTSRKQVYHPEWGSYDVMRNRWSYIWPQTRQLRGTQEQILPTTSAKIVTVPRTHIALMGSVFDAETFRKTVRKAESHHSLISSRSHTLSNTRRMSSFNMSTASPSLASGSYSLSPSGILRSPVK